MKDLMEALNRAHELDEARSIKEERVKTPDAVIDVNTPFHNAAIAKELGIRAEDILWEIEPDGFSVDPDFKDYIVRDVNGNSYNVRVMGPRPARRKRPYTEAAFSGGYAEGGFLDTAKRPSGSTKGSGTNFKALDGKKTRTVKAKDLKPGMITDTGKILKVTNIGWVNGKPSVEVSYGGIGNRGSYASDTVAADRDYEVLDEAYGYDGSGKPVRVKSWKNDFITNREIVWQHVSDDENCDIEELEEVGLYDPATDTLTIPRGTKLKYEGIDDLYIQRACYSMPDYNDAMIYINFDYWNYEFSSYVKAHKLN